MCMLWRLVTVACRQTLETGAGVTVFAEVPRREGSISPLRILQLN